MANVSHASLTGSNLHEPKGADTAVLGTVYVSNGAGSGTWNSIGTSAFTGMVADFAAPVAPSGWLELDGSVISTSTFSALYGVMAMQTSGTRINGNPTITSIPSTALFKTGYFVFGTGITTGTTILSIDSATQVTLSANSTSGGSSAFAVSPFLLNTGTIKLPDMTTAGRYRRSRTSTTKVGDLQVDLYASHNHTGALTTGFQSADHAHGYSGVTGNENQTHTHGVTAAVQSGFVSDITPGSVIGASNQGLTTGTQNQNHNHNYSGTTGGINASHNHTVTIPSDGGAETRPISMVYLTCIKT